MSENYYKVVFTDVDSLLGRTLYTVVESNSNDFNKIVKSARNIVSRKNSIPVISLEFRSIEVV